MLDKNGMPVLDQKGKVIYKEVPLKTQLYRVFGVYNGEQIEGLPPYQPRPAAAGELEKKVDALLESAECTILETAQDEAFYQRGCDTIYLPLRSAFRDLEAFASAAAHEMIHSTGHPSRLNRAFGKWPGFGPPDDLYCMEELRAELGSFFLMMICKFPCSCRESEALPLTWSITYGDCGSAPMSFSGWQLTPGVRRIICWNGLKRSGSWNARKI